MKIEILWFVLMLGLKSFDELFHREREVRMDRIDSTISD